MSNSLASLATGRITPKAPIFPFFSQRFGPVIRHLAGLSHGLKATEAAAQHIEAVPQLISAAFMGEPRLRSGATNEVGGQSVTYINLANNDMIFALPTEFEGLNENANFQRLDQPHEREAIICLAEIYQRMSKQNQIESGRAGPYCYQDPPELCRPHQRIYGGKGYHRVPPFISDLQVNLPVIFNYNFADLGGAFGWPTHLWAQFIDRSSTAAMFESRPELVAVARESGSFLTSLGVNCSNVAYHCADFLTADLSPYPVLYAYHPFVNIENPQNCAYKTIFNSLLQQNWQGRFLVFYDYHFSPEETSTDRLAQANGYKRVYYNAERVVYERITFFDTMATSPSV